MADLHIVPGRGAAACIRRGLGVNHEAVIALDDHLAVGPLSRVDSVADWGARRAAFWARVRPEPGTSATIDLGALAAFEPRSVITAWVGTGLADQLFLLWCIDLLEHLRIDPTRLRVVQLEVHDERGYEITSVAMLDPDRAWLGSRPRTTLSREQLRDLRAAWQAVVAPDPQEVRTWLRRSTTLPVLTRALGSLAGFFPDQRRGLPRWDHELLHHTQAQGPRAVRIVGHTLGFNTEHLDWVGDDYLMWRLRRLGGLDPSASNFRHIDPLVRLTGDGTLSNTEVKLTGRGERVLAGDEFYLDGTEVQEWIGGTHVNSAEGRLWLTDADGRVSRRRIH